MNANETLLGSGSCENARVVLEAQGVTRVYELDEIEVALYGESPRKRVFRSGTAIWLGLEYGMQVWIPEVDPDELVPSLRA